MSWLRIEGEETDTTEPLPDLIVKPNHTEEPKETAYFDLTGRAVCSPRKGLLLRRTFTHTDSSIVTEKILIK